MHEKDEEPDHGPDYDPGTADLFEDPRLARAGEELRDGAEQMINELVREYSAEITKRLRTELSDQLKSILDDLSDSEDRQ